MKLAQFYQDATSIRGSHELRFGGSFVRIMDDRMFGAFMNPVQTLGGSLGEALDSNYYFGTGNQFERIRTGEMLVAPDSPVGALWKTDANNVAPRLGVAWDVFGDGRTSVRGGYGMGYERNFGNVTFNVIENPPAYAVVSLLAPNDVPWLPIFSTVDGPLGGTGTARLPNISTRNVAPDIVNAYAHFWSAAIQHELWKRTTVSLEYAGSAGESLYSLSNINRSGSGAYYLGDADPNARLRTTQYTNMNTRANGRRSRCHGLIAGITFSRLADMGLDLSGRYTYGRAKDHLSSTFSQSFNNFNLRLLDPFDPDLDWGWADFDVRHRATISGLYELPFFKNATGWARTLGGGWQAAWIFTAQTGAPFTVFDCSNAITTCARMAQVADIAGYTRTPTGSPNQYVYLDLANQAAGVGSFALGLHYEQEGITHITRAYERRDRVTLPERLEIDLIYISAMSGDRVKETETLEAMREAYPRRLSARRRLAVHYQSMGRFEEGLAEALEAVKLEPGSAAAHQAVARAYEALGRYAEARQAAEAAIAQGLENEPLHVTLLHVGFITKDAALVARERDWAARRSGATPWFLEAEAEEAVWRGRLRESLEYLDRCQGLVRERGAEHRWTVLELRKARYEAICGFAARAMARVNAQLAREDLGLDLVVDALKVAVSAGDLTVVARILDRLDREHWPKTEEPFAGFVRSYRAALETGRGRPQQALELLRPIQPYELGLSYGLIPLHERAVAHLAGAPGPELVDGEYRH